MNTVTNTQPCHRWLGHLNESTLESMQWLDGSGITFGGPLTDCDVCAGKKSHRLAHLKGAKHVNISAPFQLVHGDLDGAIRSVSLRTLQGCEQDHLPVLQVYCRSPGLQQESSSCCASRLCHLDGDSFSSRIVQVCDYKGGEFAGKAFQAYCL